MWISYNVRHVCDMVEPDRARKNHEWVVKTRVSIVHLQLKFNEIQNDCLTQAMVVLARFELKEIKSGLKRSS